MTNIAMSDVDDCASLPNVAPRITPRDVDNEVVAEQFWVPPGTYITICVLSLKNGFTVTGEAACVYPENFNEAVGRRLAHDKALDKVWMLLGFRLADVRHAAISQ